MAYAIEKVLYDPDLVRQLTAPEIMQQMKTLQQSLFNRRLSYLESLEIASALPPRARERLAMDINPELLYASWRTSRRYLHRPIMDSSQTAGSPSQTAGARQYLHRPVQGAIPPRAREIVPVDNYLSRLYGLWYVHQARRSLRRPIMDPSQPSQAVGAGSAGDLEFEAMELVKWLVFALSQSMAYLPSSQGAGAVGNATDLELQMMTLLQSLESALNRPQFNRLGVGARVAVGAGTGYRGYQTVVELQVMALVQLLQSALNQLQSNQDSSQTRSPSQTTDGSGNVNNLAVEALTNNLAALSTDSNGAIF